MAAFITEIRTALETRRALKVLDRAVQHLIENDPWRGIAGPTATAALLLNIAAQRVLAEQKGI